MQIGEGKHGGVVVVTPVGRLDTNTSGDLQRTLFVHLDAGAKHLVVDMFGIDYISSAGLRVLLMAAKKSKDVSGQFVLCSMNQAVRQIFDLAGFLPVFSIEASLDLALARLGSRPAG